MKQIAIIDYGLGNLHSVKKAVSQVAPNRKIKITNDPNIIKQSQHIIFPGVGSVGFCMEQLNKLKINNCLKECIKQQIPLLGICVGMQVLFDYSAENCGTQTLGFISGEVKHFRNIAPQNKIPHMGWNQIIINQTHPLLNKIKNGSNFYFAHSYYCQSKNKTHVFGQSDYGAQFASLVIKNNICAVQFHPEKSASHGLQLLNNFINWKIT